MVRRILMLGVVAVCLGCGGSAIGSAFGSSKPHSSRPKAAALRDSVWTFVAAADSILVYELDPLKGIRFHRAGVEAMSPFDSTRQADGMRAFGVPDTVPLLGSWWHHEVPFGSAGIVAKSRGRRLDEIDRVDLLALLADRGAYHQPPPNMCMFDPTIGIRIYRGAEIGEALMETQCLNWHFIAGRASAGGYLRPVLEKYRRFAIRAFRDNPAMLRELEAMH